MRTDANDPGVLNVSSPFAPYYSDEIYNMTLNWLGVWGFGPYVLMAGAPGGVDLVNATDPGNLRICARYSGASSAIQITVHGDYAYVANRTSLVILRLFNSASASFSTTPAPAQSLAVDTTADTIANATLTLTAYIPVSTSITWQLSADGGLHWEDVIPGALHTFTFTGNDLRWRATLTTGRADRSAYLYGVSITYGHVTPLVPPLPWWLLPVILVIIIVVVVLLVVLLLRRRRKPAS